MQYKDAVDGETLAEEYLRHDNNTVAITKALTYNKIHLLSFFGVESDLYLRSYEPKSKSIK